MDDPLSFLVASGVAAALCFLYFLWSLRSGSGRVFKCRAAPIKSKTAETVKQPCVCACSAAGDASGAALDAACLNGDVAVRDLVVAASTAERQTGGSMMEQLVPEITTHALSYLDYPSLCRLSMTNSAMRRAANDDSAWKALYHKDFTVEQGSITPVNGWKAYYAATKAIVNVNAEFYNIIRERSLPAMGRLWLQADYVKCVHGTGELYLGYSTVINSWDVAFNWGQGAAFHIRDVRARVSGDMAWVTMKAHVNMDGGPFHVTNVYEFHNGRWYMVHHHSSVGLIMDGAPEIIEA